MRKYLIIALNYLSKLPVGGVFFKTLYAAAAVGDGSRAIERRNYEIAYQILHRFEKDQIDDVWVSSCQYMLGTLYLNGNGVSKDEDKALSIFQAAASAGNQDAILFMKRWNARNRKTISDQSS